jgi:hypothetical protein
LDEKRLYHDLITGYNRLVRPVGNNTDKLTVHFGLKLTAILDVVRKRFSKITTYFQKSKTYFKG